MPRLLSSPHVADSPDSSRLAPISADAPAALVRSAPARNQKHRHTQDRADNRKSPHTQPLSFSRADMSVCRHYPTAFSTNPP